MNDRERQLLREEIGEIDEDRRARIDAIKQEARALQSRF